MSSLTDFDEYNGMIPEYYIHMLCQTNQQSFKCFKQNVTNLKLSSYF